MSDHYYSNQPQVESKEEKMEIVLRGEKLTFYSDRGVFSKKQIDFGSKLLIETVEVAEQAHILDVGCGYGPIGLSLAKESNQRKAMLIDVNKRALHLAGKNAQVNQINNVVIKESNLFSEVEEKNFSLILSNPPIRAGKELVHRLLEESYEHLLPGGELWIVIQKKQGAPSAFKKLQEIYGQVREVKKDKGYRIIQAIK